MAEVLLFHHAQGQAPGFLHSSLTSHDAGATPLLTRRVLDVLATR
jgi:hypothetical protein